MPIIIEKPKQPEQSKGLIINKDDKRIEVYNFEFKIVDKVNKKKEKIEYLEKEYFFIQGIINNLKELGYEIEDFEMKRE